MLDLGGDGSGCFLVLVFFCFGCLLVLLLRLAVVVLLIRLSVLVLVLTFDPDQPSGWRAAGDQAV